MRLKAKTDSNQEAIARALEKAGVAVERKLARLGDGIPDLLCYYQHRWFLLEIKMPNEKLTAKESAWHEKFPLVRIVHTIEEAYQTVGVRFK